MDAGGDWTHNGGVASTRHLHSLNLSMVILYRSLWIPTTETNYVGGCRVGGGVCGVDGDESDQSDVGQRVSLNLADRENWSSREWPERSSVPVPSGTGESW